MRVKPSKPLIYLAVLALLAGGGLLYSATRSSPKTVGSLQVGPSALTLDGSKMSPVTVRNVGPATITVNLSAPAFMVVDPVSAVVKPGRALEVEARAVASAPGGGDLQIVAGADRVSVPVTVTGTVGAPDGGASALQITDPNVTFGRGVSARSRTLINTGQAPLAWKVSSPPWLTLTPGSGTAEPGKAVAIRMEVDRSALDLGQTKARVPVTSSEGEVAFQVTVETGADPVISLPKPLLDFGIGGRTDEKTMKFTVRNSGNAELRYQASADRAFLRLGTDASGALDPGESAEVTVTFDYSETRVSYDWTAEVPITSNGGSAAMAIVGVSDWDAPALIRDSNGMKFVHDHCSGGSCRPYRHLRGTFEDKSSIILVEAEYRVCTGSGAQPTCDEWSEAPKSRRVSGTDLKGVYEIEIGPLPQPCVPGVGVIVQYRFKTADGLRNSALRPGSSTYYGYLHCSRAD